MQKNDGTNEEKLKELENQLIEHKQAQKEMEAKLKEEVKKYEQLNTEIETNRSASQEVCSMFF